SSAHSHSHGHSHSHRRDPSESNFRTIGPIAMYRPDAEPGFGRGKIVYFDAFSGVAGDMTVAALVDLGVPAKVVSETLACLPIHGYHVHFQNGYVGSIGATKFDVHIDRGQTERDFASIDRMLVESPLTAEVRDISRRIFRHLAEAEATVHRTSVDSVHFHEVGAIDSIADIVGAAACFHYLGATVWVSPLPMGRGFIDCQHGRIPLPAPATLNCLRGILTKDAGIEAELVTPTGAAIVATMAARCSEWPRLIPTAVGWGAGTRTLPDRPNALRVVLGDLGPPSPEDVDANHEACHVVLEANLDDATGELSGYTLGLMLEQGALDAWVVPITMKKGRPGVILSAIVAPADEARITSLLISETTTLGVRRHVAGRTVRPRRMIQVTTPYGDVPVKVSEGPFGPPQIKPEFDSCAKLARSRNVPVREVLAAAVTAARMALGQ
ncbi:MAG TPA: nickel pincer cofactor biosynthesis protein LarC, partial [Polyangiaceae bacterium]